MADRYRKVRRALRAIQSYIKHVEQTNHNRAARRYELFEGARMKELVVKLKEAKRHA